MPRTRAVMFIGRFAVLLLIFGLFGGVLSAIDLADGKDAATELIVFVVMLVVGVAGMTYLVRADKNAAAKDWAALPADVRRDLPYGADERDGRIVFPTKVSVVVFLCLTGAGSAVLGGYGYVVEEGTTAVIVTVMMGLFAAFFFGVAWIAHGVRWSADAHGVSCDAWPKKRIDWDSVAEFRTDYRNKYVFLSGPKRARPRLGIPVMVLEVSAADLIGVLKRLRQSRRVDSLG